MLMGGQFTTFWPAYMILVDSTAVARQVQTPISQVVHPTNSLFEPAQHLQRTGNRDHGVKSDLAQLLNRLLALFHPCCAHVLVVYEPRGACTLLYTLLSGRFPVAI